MIANSRISMNIDEDVKQNAQRVFNKLGLDLTTAIALFLRAAIVEERIPFEIRTERAYMEAAHRESAHRAYINAELDKSILEANDPNTKWISQAEMRERLAKRRENEQKM